MIVQHPQCAGAAYRWWGCAMFPKRPKCCRICARREQSEHDMTAVVYLQPVAVECHPVPWIP